MKRTLLFPFEKAFSSRPAVGEFQEACINRMNRNSDHFHEPPRAICIIRMDTPIFLW
jgi:hypothetical protein